MSVAIVGLAPRDARREPLTFEHVSGARLLAWSNKTPDEFKHLFDRINLHPDGVHHTTSDDHLAGIRLRRRVDGRRVVALGRRVGTALSLPETFWTWGVGSSFVGVVIPHPSGLNRIYNDTEARLRSQWTLARACRLCIHVEGVDGSGKSTLVDQLARSTGLSVVPTVNPPTTDAECRQRVAARVVPGTLSDRSSGLIGELVYGVVLRGFTLVPEVDLWHTVRAVRQSVTFVYCRPRLSDLRPRYRRDESREHVKGVRDNLRALYDRYEEVMREVERLGARVIRYDWTRQDHRWLSHRLLKEPTR